MIKGVRKIQQQRAVAQELEAPAKEQEPLVEERRELTRADKERVGLDEERRGPVDVKAPSTSLASLHHGRVQAARDAEARRRLVALAATIDVADAQQTAKPLGAGTFGATFDLGNGFVLKHFGDPACTMGALADTLGQGAFEAFAARQVAVHAALRDQGFNCVAAVLVEGAPTWVLMPKADGLAYAELSTAEQAQAEQACAALREAIKSTANDAIRKLGYDVGEGIDTDVHVDNARFARTPGGIVIAAFFDPTV